MHYSLPLLTAALLLHTAPAAEYTADEMLFFGTGALEKSAVKNVVAPTVTAPSASNAGVPLKRQHAQVQILLLDAPPKAYATGAIATLTGDANQAGAAALPKETFPKGGPSFHNAFLYGVSALQKNGIAWPAGLSVNYATTAAYATHEQDSAAVAATVILHSLVTGEAIDPNAVLIGGMGPVEAGSVTNVAALATRLRTLPGTAPLRIGVPLVAESDVRDLALMGEPETLVRCELLGMVSIADALAVTASQPPAEYVQASQLFEQVRAATAKLPVLTALKSPALQTTLKQIIQLLPQHLSAQILLQTALGKLPGKMSFLTSQQAILKAAQPFWQAIQKNLPAEIRKISTASGNSLSLMQPRIHPTVERYLVATRAFLRSCNNLLEILPGKQYDVMRARAIAESEKLRSEVRAEKQKLDASMK